jgi:hypothetical protein
MQPGRVIACLSTLLLLNTAPVMSGEPSTDPQAWYRDSYGPLWLNEPWDQVNAMLGHYADNVTTHESSGSITTTDKHQWLAEPIAQWRAEGWLGSELKALKTDRLNASTASFKASWLDHYSSAPDELSCGWYLADRQAGRWQFTAYADIDCAAHGLTGVAP